jgi:hypothetical protein
MKQSIKVPVVMKVLLTLLLIIHLSAPAVFGADTLPKMNKHKDKDIVCASCHDKGSTNARPDDSTCMGCHGSYADLARKTAKLDNIKAGITNPHKSHIGQARCTLCHKNHSLSVLYCNECHSPMFDMKVP